MSAQEDTRIVWTQGELLAKARRTARMSVAEMAAELAVDPKTVGNYEHDRTKPNRATRLHYANRAGWPIEWLEPLTEVTAEQRRAASRWNRRLSHPANTHPRSQRPAA